MKNKLFLSELGLYIYHTYLKPLLFTAMDLIVYITIFVVWHLFCRSHYLNLIVCMYFHIIFSVEALGYTKIVPAFLDPNLKPKDMLHGVSFASAASGYDDLTANLSVIKVLLTCIKLVAIRKGPFMTTNMFLPFFCWIFMKQNVFSVPNQLEYFMHYLIHMRNFVGEKKTTDIIRYAVFVLSMGTNDFLQNYYLQPIRSKQFKVEKYQDYLVSCMSRDIEVITLSLIFLRITVNN